MSVVQWWSRAQPVVSHRHQVSGWVRLGRSPPEAHSVQGSDELGVKLSSPLLELQALL